MRSATASQVSRASASDGKWLGFKDRTDSGLWVGAVLVVDFAPTILVGLTILAAMTARSYRGHFSPEAHHGVEIGGIYWHFVDVMWIVVYSTVYLI